MRTLKYRIFAIIVLSFFRLAPAMVAAPSALDLVGKWDALIEFGKFRMKLVLRIVPSKDGKKAQVTMDVPEQGAKDVPVSALLFNPPEVRLEIDQFGTTFNGNLSDDGSAITGEFEQGPGGRPAGATFKRNTSPEKSELPKKLPAPTAQ